MFNFQEIFLTRYNLTTYMTTLMSGDCIDFPQILSSEILLIMRLVAQSLILQCVTNSRALGVLSAMEIASQDKGMRLRNQFLCNWAGEG